MPKTRKPFVDFRAIRGRITMEQVLEHYGVLHTFKRTGSRSSSRHSAVLLRTMAWLDAPQTDGLLSGLQPEQMEFGLTQGKTAG